MELIALDQGTTSSRALLFAADGQPKAVGQREFTQQYPTPGWVEHDAEEIWLSQLRSIEECLSARSSGKPLIVGITNQRETILVWDRKSGRPLHPAIVWQDRRTTEVTRRIAAGPEAARIIEKTGLQIDPYFSATKLQWLLDHIPNGRARADAGELAAGTIDAWLIWKLTDGQVHATDVTNASRTMLMSLTGHGWDTELLNFFGIPASLMPEIRPSAADFGECRVGPLVGSRITGVLGDQQAALFGQGCREPGMAKNTYGTGSFLLMHTGNAPVASRNRLLSTVAWEHGGGRSYATEGSVFVSGAVVQWLRDGLGLFRVSPMIEALANSVPDSGGVTFVPAFTGLGAPHWEPDARGLICGLTRGTTDAHIARAALEAIALQSRDVLMAMENDSGTPLLELRVDGGASRNDLLMQIQADVLQRTVVRPAASELTAFGAALMAAVGAGAMSLEQLPTPAVERRFEPRDHPGVERLLEEWAAAVKLTRLGGTAQDDATRRA